MSDSQHYDDSLKRLEEEFEKVKDGMDTVSDRLGNLSDEVAKTTIQHDRLSAEHSALTSRVNHIDLRISVMEETTRLQNKHNDEIHRDFKNGLSKMESSVTILQDKLDNYSGRLASSIERVHEELHNHTKIEEMWQKKLLIGIAGGAIAIAFGVLGYFGRWIFITVVGG